MTVSSGEVLTYRKGYGKDAKTVVVTDRNGVEIHAGDYLECVVTTHNWLKQGDIVKAVHAREGSFQASIYYEDMQRSQSGIGAGDCVRVDTTPELRKEFEKVWLYHRLAQVNETISRFIADRAKIQFQIDQLGA